MHSIKQFIDSLYSVQNMAKYRKQNLFQAFVFIILLNFIASIPTFFQTQDTINEIQRELIPQLRKVLPEFQIENGLLTTEQIEERIISTDKITIKLSPEQTEADTPMKTTLPELEILKDKVVLKIENQYFEAKYEDMALTFTKDNLISIMDVFEQNVYLIQGLYLFLFFISHLIMLIVQIFLVSFLGYILVKQEKYIVSYQEIWSVSPCALVIPTVFFTIMNLLHLTVPFGTFVFWGSAICIIYQIIKEFPRK